MSRYNYDGTSQFKPISAWGYIGYSILFAIPIIGLILLIVFAFSDRNINRRSYARSYFCWLLIAIIISVLVVTGVLSGLINDSARSKLTQVQHSIEAFVGKTLGTAPKPTIDIIKDNRLSDRKNPEVPEPESESNHSVPAEAKPVQETETEAPAEAESSTSKEDMARVQVGGKTLEIRKSFKDAMDEYSAFFEEYIDVMERQDILRMAAMTAKYAEMSEAFEKLDESEDLSNAESAYYIHIQSQINEKLATVGQ